MINLRKNILIDGINLISFLNLSEEEKIMVLEWRNHNKVREWMYSSKVIEMQEHLDFLEKLKTANKYYWLFKIDDYIGVLDIYNIDLKNKHAYAGIYTNPFSQIPGKGKLLMSIGFNLCFEKLNLHTVKLEVLETNNVAVRLYEKMGFKQECKLKEFVLKDNKWLDVIIMGKTNLEKSI